MKTFFAVCLVVYFCFISVDFAFAKYLEYESLSCSATDAILQDLHSQPTTMEDKSESSEDDILAEVAPVCKSVYASGTVQLALIGFDWSIATEENKNIEIWVWMDSLSTESANKSGYWYSLSSSESIEQPNPVIRIKFDEKNKDPVQLCGFNDSIQKYAEWPSIEVDKDEIELLAENKLLQNNQFKPSAGKSITYELVMGSEGLQTSLDSYVQHFLTSSMLEKKLLGVIIPNSRGLLDEIIEIDQAKLKSDKIYKIIIFDYLSKILLRDDQFMIVISEY